MKTKTSSIHKKTRQKRLEQERQQAEDEFNSLFDLDDAFPPCTSGERFI